ncbi:hypothetical protein SAMN04487783_2156 [Agrococcus baldri]|uniref:N-acetyltransferase domain-containing protein n=1 Tax=Agrococcus baldri TaxID=153730 RepID=A0AA94HNL1_9MICO|nr:hypothetical protein [Agrococcus baldri]SFS15897.1 hypothetical protein SAMN04487783_2156 [Agrococcus baldri]
MHIDIRSLALPERWDEQTPTGDSFRAAAAHAARVNDERFGIGVAALTLEERLAAWQSSEAELHVRRLAFDGAAIVGAASVWLPMLESLENGDHGVAVEASVPALARRAVIEALTDDAERIAAEHGRTTLMGGSPAAANGAVMAATGFGGVDPDEPEAAALLARGYALEQVYRFSLADVRALGAASPGLDERWADASARARDAGYDTIAWSGETPAEYRPAMRTLHEAMSTDAPIGGLALEPETWSDERLAEFERQKTAGGRTMRTVVARHIASGELAGFTSLFVGAEIGAPGGDVARQHDTLVRRDHRGHALGMLLKLANLVQLRDHHPMHPRVSTMNAEENRHMLAVNEATGFEAVAYEAVWQRKDA